MKKSIRLRFAEPSDAAFILSLRLDPSINRYLSEVEDNEMKQREWLLKYKKREVEGSEFYFIIERSDKTKCGTVRIYDLQEESFSWGSWILNEDKTRYAAVESALLVYEWGFEKLGYTQSHFEVMKGNTGVIKFHQRMGAELVGEDAINFYFRMQKADLQRFRDQFYERVSNAGKS